MLTGGHEANTVLHPPEGIAEIRSCRERGARKRKFHDMVENVTLINSVISAASDMNPY